MALARLLSLVVIPVDGVHVLLYGSDELVLGFVGVVHHVLEALQVVGRHLQPQVV